MRVLVTGGAGYIGSHMVLCLLDAGIPVVVLDDFSAGFREAVPEGVPLAVGDVGDGALVRSTIREHDIDSVLHFAAFTSVPDSILRPFEYYENNTAKTLALAASCADAGVSNFVLSSTAAVYGEPSGPTVSEADPTAPLSPYGWSKLMAERMLTDAHAAGRINYAALRYFNVAGADVRGRAGQRTENASHLIKVACEVATGRRKSLEVFGTEFPTRDGTCIRDYVHVSDLASAHLHLLRHLVEHQASASTPRNAPILLNCGYGRGSTVFEVIAAVEAAAGHKLNITLGPPRPGDAVEVVAEACNIRKLLKWEPMHADLGDIVSSALNFERRRS